MRCPVCGEMELVHDVRDVSYTYKGETTSIPQVDADFCPACGEYLAGPAETRRVMQLMKEFTKEVNASIVDPRYISEVRSRLRLNQQDAARLFGGGVNAFSRYETGKSKPPLALVQLFRILDRHPELLRELDPEAQTEVGIRPLQASDSGSNPPSPSRPRPSNH